jgi:hypothetical protein
VEHATPAEPGPSTIAENRKGDLEREVRPFVPKTVIEPLPCAAGTAELREAVASEQRDPAG